MEGFERDQLDRGARAALGRPGDPDARDDPPRLEARLLAARDRHPPGRAGRPGSTPPTGSDYSASQMASSRASSGARLGGRHDEPQGDPRAAGVGQRGHQRGEQWLDLVRVPPSGTWERRRADLYAAAEHWLGPPPKIDEVDGIELLVRRYLGAFGPAAVAEIANWAGLPSQRGLPGRSSGSSCAGSRPRTARSCWTFPGRRCPTPRRRRRRGSCRRGMRPCWRTRVAPGSCRRSTGRRSSTRETPQSVSTFLVDGQVAGTWRYEKGKVKTKPFGRLDAAARRELRGRGRAARRASPLRTPGNQARTAAPTASASAFSP